MPIYEYYCPVCHVRFNALQKIDDPPPACPRCKGADVKKMISAAALVHTERQHEAAYKERQGQIGQGDRREVARFFRENSPEPSRRLEGQLTSSDAFAELLDRVNSGAADADMADIEDALAEAAGSPYKMGEYTPEPEEARLAAHSEITGELLDERERERKQEMDEKRGPGHEYKMKYGYEDDHGHEKAQEETKAPKSPWSADNIGWA